MSDYERLYTGLSHAAWGYFLLHFNFNLNFDSVSINILPSFAGALLLLSAVDKLSAERRDLKLLRPLCMILAAWHLADWVLALTGSSLSGKLLFLDLIFTVVLLYFHFQFLTDMAAIAEKYQPEGETLNRRIRDRRTALLVLTTIADVASGLVQLLELEQVFEMTAVVWGLLSVAVLIVIVMIMFSLFQLRRYVRDWGAAEPPTE